MTLGKVYVHQEFDEVIVVAVQRIDERWCDYLVLSTFARTDIQPGETVKMEDWHLNRYYREWDA